jgi:hypothetical protein
MRLPKCGRCGRTIRVDASRCPTCLAADGFDPPPAPKNDTAYRIAMLATGCAILLWLLVIRR